MRTINRKQYKKLAKDFKRYECSSWMSCLEGYSHDILIHGEAVILDSDYKRARSAADPITHTLLDSIFGKDEPEFKKDEYVVLLSFGTAFPDYTSFHIGGVYKLISDITNELFTVKKDDNGSENNGYSFDGVKTMKFRHATPSEIESYKKKMK
jgi:hypothetical protein